MGGGKGEVEKGTSAITDCSFSVACLLVQPSHAVPASAVCTTRTGKRSGFAVTLCQPGGARPRQPHCGSLARRLLTCGAASVDVETNLGRVSPGAEAAECGRSEDSTNKFLSRKASSNRRLGETGKPAFSRASSA